MGLVRATETVALDPPRALQLWTDLRRWPTFVEGFARTVEVSSEWPEAGGKLVWESIPGGRGRVTERVTTYEPPTAGAEGGADSARGRIVSQVFEEALAGTQSFSLAPERDGASAVLELDYELARSGPLRKVADVLFIRRALGDALARTLRRFATEAQEQASL